MEAQNRSDLRSVYMINPNGDEFTEDDPLAASMRTGEEGAAGRLRQAAGKVSSAAGEAWALIALLCYIVTLHGRLAGWWTQFGLVVASVVCFLAVLMAWYGVNFVLGKGLHSYGFGLGGETYVVSFVLADLLFVAFAIWRYRGTKPARTPNSPAAVVNERIAA